jgi:hypothetical protein
VTIAVEETELRGADQGCQISLDTTYQKIFPMTISLDTTYQKIFQMTISPNTTYQKIFQMTIKSTKLDQMAIKYTNIFRCKPLQNLPKFGFLVGKFATWQPWRRRKEKKRKQSPSK